MSGPTPSQVPPPLRICAYDYAYELKFPPRPSRVRVHPPLHVCAWFVTRYTLSYGVSCYSSHTKVCLNSPLELCPTSRDHTTLCVNYYKACPSSETHNCSKTSRGADLLCTPSHLDLSAGHRHGPSKCMAGVLSPCAAVVKVLHCMGAKFFLMWCETHLVKAAPPVRYI